MVLDPWKGVLKCQLVSWFHIKYLRACGTVQSEATECPVSAYCVLNISKMSEFSSKEVMCGNAAETFIFIILLFC